MSTILLLVTVMLMALTLTVAVHVYCPASEVLIELKERVTVLLVLTAPTLILFRAVSPPALTACLVHTMAGWIINPSTTPTIHVSVIKEPGDMVPLEVVITVGGGRTGLEEKYISKEQLQNCTCVPSCYKHTVLT